jgi:hypothetical protein
VHAAGPELALNFPAAHAKHAPPSGPVYPGLHRQSTGASLAVGLIVLTGQLEHVLPATAPVDAEYLPAAQSSHAAEPVAVLYFPARHNTHVPPLPQAQSLLLDKLIGSAPHVGGSTVLTQHVLHITPSPLQLNTSMAVLIDLQFLRQLPSE